MIEQDIHKKPYKSDDYDHYIQYTMPFVNAFYEQTISLIQSYGNTEGHLLDLGSGTGKFEEMARQAFPCLMIEGLDPSDAMMTVAENKKIPGVVFHKGVTLDLSCTEKYDIITAIESDHFMQPEERIEATAKVYNALKTGGIYICFENVLPDDGFLRETELSRWESWQIDTGKDPEEASIHKKRCGTFYFPITTSEHIHLLENTGFAHTYVFWRSYMQMGILGIK